MFERVLRATDARSTGRSRNRLLVVLLLLATMVLNIYLFYVIPKGFFPEQDTGQMIGGMQADQSSSFQSRRSGCASSCSIVQTDPDVQTRWWASPAAVPGGGQTNSGFMIISLKPKSERKVSAEQVIARLRPKLGQVTGAQPVPAAGAGPAHRRAPEQRQYQYTLEADDVAELYTWATKLAAALLAVPELADVNSDQQDNGLEVDLTDRPRHGLAPAAEPGLDRQHALRRLRPARRVDHLQGRSTSTTW